MGLQSYRLEIRIYAWAAVEGEIETLQEKRLAYVQEHNEAVK